jgi:hypothetical protein
MIPLIPPIIGPGSLLTCLCIAWALAKALNLLVVVLVVFSWGLSVEYPDPVLAMESPAIELETLDRLILQVFVDWVELLAALSFRLLDRFESCDGFLVTVHEFRRR